MLGSTLFYGSLLAFLENEKLVECLIAENTEMKAKLKDVGTSPRYFKKQCKQGHDSKI